MTISSLLVTEDAVREALRLINDPELDENLVDLGLVYGIQVDGGRVQLELSVTTPGCPLQDTLPAAAERAIYAQVPGVEAVEVRVVLQPRWTPERVSPAARSRLGFDR